MTTAKIFKPLNESGMPSEQDLEMINKYTLRDLAPEELYIFSLTLCDNLVDRDHERFTADALRKLEKLFIGKTGIFDHDPKGRNQTARIFKTWVEADPLREAVPGEHYHCLKARAYMARCELTRTLILEIEAGIKKEVSVGCAVAKLQCSICGADPGNPCTHKKGRIYNGRLCFTELMEPTDAYEWSFVAVPAQQGAGVTKRHKSKREEDIVERINSNTNCRRGIEAASIAQGCERDTAPERDIIKKLSAGSEITLSAAEADALLARYDELCGLADAGRAYMENLKGEVMKYAALSGAGIDAAALSGVVKKMDLTELTAFKNAFMRKAGEQLPLKPQLAPETRDLTAHSNNQFKI